MGTDFGAKEYREFADILRKTSDCAIKVAEYLEKEDVSEEEVEQAIKDFIWEVVKFQSFAQNFK